MTVDNSAPTKPATPTLAGASDTGLSNSDEITNDNTPTITGSANDGNVVKVYANAVLVATSTPVVGGTYSIATSALGDAANIAITVTETDLALNESIPSDALLITVDTGAPAAPGQPELSDAEDSGLSQDDYNTNEDTPTLTGAATDGFVVKIYSSGSLVGTSSTIAGGTYAVQTSDLPDGARTLTARHTDVAGNESGDSPSRAITIDTSAPAAPSTPDLSVGDVGISTTDNITTTESVTFASTANVGSIAGLQIRVYSSLPVASTLIGSGTLNGSGGYSIAATLATEGAQNIAVTAVDVAGNESTSSSSLSVTYDNTPPSVSDITLVETNPSTASDLDFLVTFDAPVRASTVTTADFTVNAGVGITGPPAVNTTSPTTGSSSTITVNVNNIGGNGQLGLTRAATAIEDVAGNTSSVSFIGTNFYTIDNTAPSVTIQQAGTQSDPGYGVFATGNKCFFTITFSEPVTGLTTGDFNVDGGTSTYAATAVSSSDGGTTYTAEFTVSGSGTIIPALPGSAAQDVVGQNSSASTSPVDGQVTFILEVANPTAVSASAGTVGARDIDIDLTGETTVNHIVVAREGAPVSFVPVDGTDYSGIDANFANATAQDVDGNKILVQDNSWPVSFSGFSGGKTYHFAVFTSNEGVTGFVNYNDSSVPTTSITTSACSYPTQATVNATSNINSTGAKINWTRNSGANDRSFVILKQGASAATTTPVDGASYTSIDNADFTNVGAALGDGQVVFAGEMGGSDAPVQSVTLSGLTENTQYTAAIYSYNSSTFCYTTPAITTTFTTTGPKAENTIVVSPTLSEPATFTYTDASPGTDVFDFTVNDIASGSDGDGAKMLISSITIFNGNTGIDWSLAIEGARLSDGDGNSTTTMTLAANSITFTGISTGGEDLGEIDDGESKTYTLEIWLNDVLPAALQSTIDNEYFVFEVNGSSIGTAASSSTLSVAQGTISSGAAKNQVNIVASTLAFQMQPPANAIATVAFAAASQPILTAKDARGNFDLNDITATVTTPDATLVPNSAPTGFSNGYMDFSTAATFNYQNAGSSRMTVTTTSPALNVTSTTSTSVTASTAVAQIFSDIAGSPLNSSSTDRALLAFSLTTTGSTLSFSALTVNTNNDPDVALVSAKLVRSNDNTLSTAGDNVDLATGSFVGNTITFGSFAESISSTTEYFFIVADIEDNVYNTTPQLRLTITPNTSNLTINGNSSVTGAAFNGNFYSFNDVTAPTVLSIATTGPAMIYEGALQQEVEIVFSESMETNASFRPQLSVSAGSWNSFVFQSWSATNVSNDTYTARVTHTGTQQDIDDASISIVTPSNARDESGINLSGGGTSNTFDIDTDKPAATVTFSQPSIYLNQLTQIVTASFDEDMNTSSTPAFTISGTTAFTPDDAGVWEDARTWSRTYSHNGTSETTTATFTLSATAATDVAGNVTLSSNAGFAVDTQQPTISSFTSPNANGNYTTSNVLTIQAVFSEIVEVDVTGGTPTLTLSSGGTATYASGSGTTTLSFTYTVGAGETSATALAVTAFNLNGGTIKDNPTNDAILTLPSLPNRLQDTKSLIIDTTAPTVTTVTSSTGDGAFNAGSIISIQVTFAEPVDVTGAPRIKLNAGASAYAYYSSGTGTSILTFVYTVANGETSADLDYDATTSLELNSGTIRDVVSINATLTLPTVGGASSIGGSKDIEIDTTFPTVTSIDIISSVKTFGKNGRDETTAEFKITFSEDVYNIILDNNIQRVTDGDVSLSDNFPPLSVPTVSVPASTTSNEVIVTASGITGTGVFRINFRDDDGVTDAAGNPVGGIGASNGNFPTSFTFPVIPGTGEAYSIVHKEPSEGFTTQTFAVQAISETSATINWQHPGGAQPPTHYLIQVKEATEANYSQDPTDGTHIDDDATALSDAFQDIKVLNNGLATQSINISNLKSGTGYDFRIFGYTLSPNVDQSNIDFNLTSKSVSGETTTGAYSTLEYISHTATLSSLIDNEPDGQDVFLFRIEDDELAPAIDNSPFKFNKIVFSPGANNTVTNWSRAIAGAVLSDGTTSVSLPTITSNTIEFDNIDASASGEFGFIDDDGEKTYTLTIWLHEDLNTGAPENYHLNIDEMVFDFRVAQALSSIETDDTDQKSSTLHTTADVSTTDGTVNGVKVDVQSTELIFSVQPSAAVGVDVALPQQPEVRAIDENGNTDKGYDNVSLIVSTAQGIPLTNAPSLTMDGVLSFSGFAYGDDGNGAAGNGTLRVHDGISFNNGVGLTDDESTAVTVKYSNDTRIIPGTINDVDVSSIIDTQLERVNVFNFSIQDDVAPIATENDGTPTDIKTITISRSGDNDNTNFANWTKVIGGAVLSDDEGNVSNAASLTIAADEITFSVSPTSLGRVADGDTKLYTLSIWLRNDVYNVDSTLADVIDNKILGFQVLHSDLALDGATEAASQSSRFSSTSDDAGVTTIEVDATHLHFTTQVPSLSSQNYDAPITPMPHAKARDINRNRDHDFGDNGETVTVETANTALFPVLNETLDVTDGLIEFDPAFQITSANNGPSGGVTYLIISSTGLTEGHSNSFSLNYSNESTIVQSYNYPVANENIEFISIDADNIDTDAASRSIVLEEFTLNDGGADLDDTDGSATTLTDITFAINNWENLKQLALYDGLDHLAELSVADNIVAGEITFSGLSFTADDNDLNTLSLRASFQDDVDDNEVITFTVTAVVAKTTSSSQFLDTTPGVTSAVVGDENKIEVITTELDFNISPDENGTNSISSYVAVNNPYPVVHALDANGNLDVDYNGTIDAPTSSIAMQNLPTGNFTNGIYDFGTKAPTFMFTEDTGGGTATLTFKATGLNEAVIPVAPSDAVSDPFQVSSSQESIIVFNTGSTNILIPYKDYQSAGPIASDASDSYQLAQFTLVDGGLDVDGVTVVADIDGASTVLTDISISFSNNSHLRQVALFDETNTLIAGSEQTVTANTINWSGLTITATDNNTKRFSVRATFAASVTDNTPINLQITSVTNGGGSKFAAADGGGAITPAGQNLIDVVATKFAFTTQPDPDALVLTDLTTTPVVQAQDALNNLDIDYISNNISITNTANSYTLSHGSLSLTAADAGVLTFPATFQYYDSPNFPSVSGDQAQLTVSDGIIADATSSSVTLRYSATSKIEDSAAEPARISSLRTVSSGSAPIRVFSFTFSEDDNTAGDGSPTRISQIILRPGAGNQITNWTGLIAEAYLTDDEVTNPTKLSGTVAGTTITFDLDIATFGFINDNTDKTYALMIRLRDALADPLPSTVDELHLAFSIDDDDVDLNGRSSQFTGSESLSSDPALNEIEVIATQLVFTKQPNAELLKSKDISLQQTDVPQIQALDRWNNRDLGYSPIVVTINAETLPMSNAPTNITNGLLTFANDFQFNEIGNGKLTVTSSTLAENATIPPTAAVSQNINVRVGISTTITTAPLGEPSSISSLVNNAAVAVEVFNFTVNDDDGLASTATENDGSPTLITKVIISQNATNNTITDWRDAIAGAILTDGTDEHPGVIGADTITFNGISTADLGLIADDDSKTYTLKVYLKSLLGGNLRTTIDNKKFEFRVLATNITTSRYGTSFINSENETSGDANKVIVEATKLTLINAPAQVSIYTDISPALQVEARDVNDNLDIDFTGVDAVITAFTVPVTYVNGPAVNTHTFTNGVYTFPVPTTLPDCPDCGFQYLSDITGSVVDGNISMTAGKNTQPSISIVATPNIDIISSFESMVIYDPAFEYSSTLEYIESTTTKTALAGFTLSDGAVDVDGVTITITPDADGATTNLESITFDITTNDVGGSTDIKNLSLFNAAGTEIDDQVLGSATSVTFNLSNGDIEAEDNGATTFTVRANFNETAAKVFDHDVIQIRISNVKLYGGSQLDPTASITGGDVHNGTGVVTGAPFTPSTVNRINVKATSLDFTTQPVGADSSWIAGINKRIGSLPVIEARDANDVVDIDYDDTNTIAGYRSLTLSSPEAIISNTSFDFQSGVVQVPSTFIYTSPGNGTLTADANGITSNKPGFASETINVIHTEVTLATEGVITSTNLPGGSVNKVIFGVTFDRSNPVVAHPLLEEFIISFFTNTDGTYSPVSVKNALKNFKIFESTDAVFQGETDQNIASLGATVTLSTDNTYLTIDFGAGHDMTATGSDLTYFLMVDVDEIASSNTPNIIPAVVDNTYRGRSGNVIVSAGSSFGVAQGQEFTFASIFPPILAATYPKVGQLNVATDQPTIALEFNRPVWTLDGEIELYKKDGVDEEFVASLDALNGNFGDFPGDKTTLSTVLKFALPTLVPDQIYFIKIPPGNNTGTDVSAYAGIMDENGNKYGGIDFSGTVYFKTTDERAPKILTTTTVPAASKDPSIFELPTGAVLEAAFDVTGKAFFIVVPDGSPEPSIAEIKDPGLSYGNTYAQASGTINIDATNPLSRFGVITSLTPATVYDVYVYGESYAERDSIPIPLANTGHYLNAMNNFIPGSGFETFSFTTSSNPVGPIKTSKPTLTMCANSFQTMSQPIIIAEGGDMSGFSNNLLNGDGEPIDQTFNLLLPSGFEFDLETEGQLYLSGGDFTGTGSLRFINSSILRVAFKNRGSTSYDFIAITGLKIKSTTASEGDITRLGGIAFPLAVPDESVLAALTTYASSVVPFTNSYSETEFPGWNTKHNSGGEDYQTVRTIPNNYSDGVIQLIPLPESGDYGPNIFSGQGVNVDKLSLGAVTLSSEFAVTLTHTDNNGCVTENIQQYLVYDHTLGIPSTGTTFLETSYCFINDEFTTDEDITSFPSSSVDGVGDSLIMLASALTGYELYDVKAKIVPLAGSPFTIRAGWENYIANNILIRESEVLPDIYAPSNYFVKQSSILNANAFDSTIPHPYSEFISEEELTDGGRKYIRGGSLGKIELTAEYKSRTNSEVQIARKHQIEIFVPAVPVVEAYEESDSDGNGVQVFCSRGGLIKIKGYPLGGDNATGTFTLTDENGLDRTSALTGDNGKGTASIDPSLLGSDERTLTVNYLYSPGGGQCPASGTLVIRIVPNPTAAFEVGNQCVGPVSFVDVSTPGQDSEYKVTEWLWNFADPNESSENPNTSTAQNPTHNYTNFGSYLDVSLSVKSAYGCPSETVSQDLDLGGIPEIEYKLSGVSTEIEISLDTSTVENFPNDAFKEFTVTSLVTGAEDFFTTFKGTLNYSPTQSIADTIRIDVVSQKNCANSLETVLISMAQQTPSDDAPYSAQFNSGDDAWLSFPITEDNDNMLNSWIHENGKWSTSGNNRNIYALEKSALYSPVFDLSNLSRAIISFIDTVMFGSNISSGVVLEYSTDTLNIADEDKDWKRLGMPVDEISGQYRETGFNWFNKRDLSSAPGAQEEGFWGWSDEILGQSSKHSIEGLEYVEGTSGPVVFRFALATTETGAIVRGFTLDSVLIGSGTRVVLLENFTNTSGQASRTTEVDENKVITEFKASSYPSSIVKINYHTAFPSSDPFNLENQSDNGSRALYYNITSVPQTRLDGIVPADAVNSPFNEWGSSLFDQHILDLASATITPDDVQVSGGIITVRGAVKALQGLPETALLHVVMLEEDVKVADNPTLAGRVNEAEETFNYVMRKMLPSALGTPLSEFNNGEPLKEGDVIRFGDNGALSWSKPQLFGGTEDDLGVVIFIQDEITKTVYQSILINDILDPDDEDVVGIEDPEHGFSVYPNPADQSFIIQLPKPVTKRSLIRLYDQVGKVVTETSLERGESKKSVSTTALAAGVYMLQVETDNGMITQKVMIVHKQ
ncbi:MAG TPA: Ig-like domain-containing protein [Chryseosolibacter sp.]|nr:Ig-like domain-containing protein [Chryseosolibacter sp.]